MSEVSYETMLKEVLPFAPNCPEPVAINAIRNACIDFCAVTQWLTVALDPITVTIDEPLYEIDVPTGYEVAQVLNPLFFLGSRLEIVSPLVIRGRCGVDWETLEGEAPTLATMHTDNELRLVPIPNRSRANAITGRIALKPTRASTTVDSRLLEHHAEVLAHGALERILRIPEESYTSAEKSSLYAHLYRFGRAKARGQVMMAHSTAELAVTKGRQWP